MSVVLLVEDDPEDVALTTRALKRHNLANQLQVANDGAEALDILCVAPPPRVVLLDLKLPKITGLDVLKRIRSDERLRTLPVVVLTSSREEPDIARAYALGANSYIVKPVDFEQFIKAVGEAGLYWMLLNQPACRIAG
jgi:two-component system response regulator